jgi:hypothetical protein
LRERGLLGNGIASVVKKNKFKILDPQNGAAGIAIDRSRLTRTI